MKTWTLTQIGLFLIFAAPSARAATAGTATDRREVSTSGQCNHTVTPDRGQVTMAAQAQDPDLQVAARKANEAYERAVEAVKKLGLENAEYRTTEYSLNEVREWEKNRLVSKGFRARLGLLVATSSLQKLGQVIAIGAREDLQDISGLKTFLSPEKRRKEHFACLQEASEDARSKALKLAEALGAKLGEVDTISENTNEPQFPVHPMMVARAMGKSMAQDGTEPAIEAGQQEISVTVQASFALK